MALRGRPYIAPGGPLAATPTSDTSPPRRVPLPCPPLPPDSPQGLILRSNPLGDAGGLAVADMLR